MGEPQPSPHPSGGGGPPPHVVISPDSTCRPPSPQCLLDYAAVTMYLFSGNAHRYISRGRSASSTMSIAPRRARMRAVVNAYGPPALTLRGCPERPAASHPVWTIRWLGRTARLRNISLWCRGVVRKGRRQLEPATYRVRGSVRFPVALSITSALTEPVESVSNSMMSSLTVKKNRSAVSANIVNGSGFVGYSMTS